MSYYQILCEQSRWLIGAGEIRFWKENWAGEILERPQPCDETLTVAQGLLCLEELWEFILHNLKATDSGKFSTKAFRSVTRPHVCTVVGTN